MAYVDIGGTPTDENCAQTGSTPDYDRLNRLECRAYAEALKQVYGPPPKGGEFRVHGNRHDFGTYYEVRFHFEPSDEATPYAYRVENGLATWDEAGMWPPVTYDDRGQPVHVLDKPETWSKTANPECLTELPAAS